MYKNTQITKQENEIAILDAQIEQARQENDELQRFLDSDDIDDYIERVAIEKHGYAYPDEIRIYVTSKN